MKTQNKNLIILFPGRSYSAENPLLYYAEFKYAIKEYEIIKVDYGDCLQKAKSFDNAVENIKKHVAGQIKSVDFSQYVDIVFISKSLGTVVAGWLSEELGVENIRHIYLTPINETIPYIKHGKNISVVIAGTNDRYLESDALKKHCENEKVPLELIEGVDHSLEVLGEMNMNIDILKRVVELY